MTKETRAILKEVWLELAQRVEEASKDANEAPTDDDLFFGKGRVEAYSQAMLLIGKRM